MMFLGSKAKKYAMCTALFVLLVIISSPFMLFPLALTFRGTVCPHEVIL